ncbi:hypothetical protein GO755_29885 [Spirosoma sp. HMF4905]|uniref:XRE family transcriptional regulator n=1 Tax=Spirosoma arboris TaxID=2682092 RepID=A0A7K1SKE1_9BACT|nr:hypothetical protein [Spirosoma arboris]MVM34279.1 hypothetical protein [Spirosoma arboris]
MINKGTFKREKINGQWLVEAIEAQGETLHSAAKLINVDSRYFYAHKAGKTSISTAVLAALCQALPTLSERYVLTGRGPKKITTTGVDADIVVDIYRIKNTVERIINELDV